MKHLILICILSLLHHPAFAQDGKALYATYCAQCHGPDLRGGNAPSMVDGIWKYGDGRGYRIRNIKNGLTELGMPGYEKQLTNRQIAMIVDFIEQQEKEVGQPKPPPPDFVQTLDYDINVDIWVQDLQIPWGIDFIDPQTALITERPGTLRMVKNGQLLDPVAGTPQVVHEGQGGLMDVAIDPNYAENGWIYLAYSHEIAHIEGQRRSPAMTRIVRGHIRDNTWTNQQVIYEAPQETYLTTRHHYGTRIVFDANGYLYFAIGDRGVQNQAQDLTRPNGKVHRIHTDGRIPKDNPFVSQEGALKTIYSYGHRNPQGMAVNPVTGKIWDGEHGPMGGDELNVVARGKNYGWPEITYGLNYNGTIVSDRTHQPEMEQPTLYWRPSIAICGINFYQGNMFSKWQNKLLVASLKYEDVRVLSIGGDRVLHEEVILKNAGRVREAISGPDGAVYVVLNQPDIILRLTLNAER